MVRRFGIAAHQHARYVANRPFAFPMPILACCFCSSTFNSRLALERHVRRNHCHWEL